MIKDTWINFKNFIDKKLGIREEDIIINMYKAEFRDYLNNLENIDIKLGSLLKVIEDNSLYENTAGKIIRIVCYREKIQEQIEINMFFNDNKLLFFDIAKIMRDFNKFFNEDFDINKFMNSNVKFINGSYHNSITIIKIDI